MNSLRRRLLLTCVVVSGALFGIVSCERLTLTEPPTAVPGTAIPGYPDIRAMIDETLDQALVAADAAAARSAAPDPAYATLRSVLSRARDANVVTARALNLDRAALVELTEQERQELEALVEKDPELRAGIEALTAKLKAEHAAIPPIEVTAQALDEEGNPAGDPYVITSGDGVIDLGYAAFTTWEFLLLVQGEARREARPERGFAIDSDWSDGGRPWPANTVKYFLDDATLSGAAMAWITGEMPRVTTGTGMRFAWGANSLWRRFWHSLCMSDSTWITQRELDRVPARASVGKTGCPFIYLDPDTVRTQDARTRNESLLHHEMGHVFGLLHEHQRHDRGAYGVRVGRRGDHLDILPQRVRHCFLWWCWYVDNTTRYGTPYDYRSVMHYPSYHGEDNITIGTDRRYWKVYAYNKRDWGSVNGNTYFTPWDIHTIRRLYRLPYATPDYRPSTGRRHASPAPP